jgi:3-isopropylmalate/(R)-2-methylmalate dehydratase large subunit
MKSEATTPQQPRTLAEKVWDDHVVHAAPGEPDLLFIDLHLVHEVTSPQAFEGLRLADRRVRRPDLTLATEDHNTPTDNLTILDPISRTQIETMRRNAEEFGIRLHSLGDIEQGIVHVIGPQLGITQPGMTIVCGDSHTATHGAFGALAFGIGTSEVEHVLATQTLPQTRPKTMAVNVIGELAPGVTARTWCWPSSRRRGPGWCRSSSVPRPGSRRSPWRSHDHLNMSIEWGAGGPVAPDETTSPTSRIVRTRRGLDWDDAGYWRTCPPTPARSSTRRSRSTGQVTPFVTWGQPGQGAPLDGVVPSPEEFVDAGGPPPRNGR